VAAGPMKRVVVHPDQARYKGRAERRRRASALSLFSRNQDPNLEIHAFRRGAKLRALQSFIALRGTYSQDLTARFQS
jgi:hypothetical protein